MPRKIDLPRVAGMVFNTPLMMDSKRLDTALAVLGHRILDGLPLAEMEPDAEQNRRERRAFTDHAVGFYANGGYLADGGIGVLPILGTLSRRATWLDSYCGMTSYAAIKDGIVEMMADPRMRGLMLEMDTPGGEAGGVFDLAEFIRDIAEATGKPVWAHANELAASAGYAIASAADEIWISQTGEVGSIGVVAAHVDMSKADEKAGMRWEYIHFGDKKVDGNPHEPLSDGARDDAQADVDELGEAFVQLVALNRGVDVEQIRDTQAGIFRGERAMEVGLADELGTFDEAMNAFADYVDELQTSDDESASMANVRSQPMARSPRANSRLATRRNAGILASQEDEDTKGKAAETEDEDAEDEDKPKGKRSAETEDDDTNAETEDDTDAEDEDDKPEGKKSAASAERIRCAELATVQKQASALGVDFNLSAAIDRGTSAAAARRAVLNAAADSDAAAPTVTARATQAATKAASTDRVKAARAKGFKRK